jgi:hypothetical protein
VPPAPAGAETFFQARVQLLQSLWLSFASLTATRPGETLRSEFELTDKNHTMSLLVSDIGHTLRGLFS